MADFTADPSLPSAAGAAAPREPRRMSSVARIFGAFYSPGATFEDIAREPHFILCWVVIAAASVFGSYTLLTRFGAYGLARQALLARPQAQTLSAAQLQAQLATAAKILPIQMYAAPVFVVLMLLLLGAIFLGAENFLLGQQVKYKPMLATVSHAMLPVFALYSLAGAAVLWLRADPNTARFDNLLGSNPAFYLDPSSIGPVWNAFLEHFDLFSFWTIGLLALGMTKLGAKVKFGSALAVVVGLWLLYVLLAFGLAVLA